jgi:hypothetical protein
MALRRKEAEEKRAAGGASAAIEGGSSGPSGAGQVANSRPIKNPRLYEEYQFLQKLLENIDEFSETPRLMIQERLEKLKTEDKENKNPYGGGGGGGFGPPGGFGGYGGYPMGMMMPYGARI